MVKLTAAKVRILDKPGMPADGAGLHLRIAPGGSRQWIPRATIGGTLLPAGSIFLPLFRGMDCDLIWLGIIVVKSIEIGLPTPPVEPRVFAISTLVRGRMGLHVVFRGIVWFLVAEAVVMIVLFAFPEVAT